MSDSGAWRRHQAQDLNSPGAMVGTRGVGPWTTINVSRPAGVRGFARRDGGGHPPGPPRTSVRGPVVTVRLEGIARWPRPARLRRLLARGGMSIPADPGRGPGLLPLAPPPVFPVLHRPAIGRVHARRRAAPVGRKLLRACKKSLRLAGSAPATSDEEVCCRPVPQIDLNLRTRFLH